MDGKAKPGGVSIDSLTSLLGVKMGRIPKLVKERALRELKEQQLKKEAALTQTHGRESSCSSLSDRSIENYDPNPMETGACRSSASLVNPFVLDLSESQVSPVQRHGGLTANYAHESSEKKLSANNSKPSSAQPPASSDQTKSGPFLPYDFTVDETDGLPPQSTGLLAPEVFQYVRSIGSNLTNVQSNTFMELTDEEAKFIR